ncbi:MAG: saccharopine dehydrogenase C-terminal domain-containing protein [Candidatus Kapaibacterium sp.]
MKILIVGSGLMGPAAAYNAMSDPGVATVTLADIDAAQLNAALRKLAPLPGGDKIAIEQLDLSDRDAAIRLFSAHDVVLAALPWSASRLAFDAAVHAGRPIVDLAIPEDEHLPELRRAAEEHGVLIALGCGLEPGLTEIMARYLALRLDSVEELHIKCGGIPEEPSGPLGYKIVFGGRQLPLRDIDALVVEGGRPFMARRYSGHELTGFEGVGEVEGWHEGMMPWLLDLPEFAAITEGTQKTLRWPGYAAKATVLLDLGLLGRTPVNVNGVDVIPKQLVDTILYPSVELKDGEGDITLFRVEVIGMKDGARVLHRADMVDRYDRALGFTSMARTTAFTGAIVARMIGRGDISATGLHYADGIVTPLLFERMMEELAAAGVHFDITSE